MSPVYSLLVNLILAIIWMVLGRNASLLSFLMGFALALLILILFQSLLNTQRYISKVKGLLWFCPTFLWVFLKANLNVARIILFIPKSQIRPAFMNYPTHNLTRFETILLSQFVTLTPGTISVFIAEDFSYLRIHVLDLHKQETIRHEIDHYLKNPMLGFTR